jgi:hypothetical protein
MTTLMSGRIAALGQHRCCIPEIAVIAVIALVAVVATTPTIPTIAALQPQAQAQLHPPPVGAHGWPGRTIPGVAGIVGAPGPAGIVGPIVGAAGNWGPPGPNGG